MSPILDYFYNSLLFIFILCIYIKRTYLADTPQWCHGRRGTISIVTVTVCLE